MWMMILATADSGYYDEQDICCCIISDRCGYSDTDRWNLHHCHEIYGYGPRRVRATHGHTSKEEGSTFFFFSFYTSPPRKLRKPAPYPEPTPTSIYGLNFSKFPNLKSYLRISEPFRSFWEPTIISNCNQLSMSEI